jgi:hypothetical protein
LGKRQPWPVMRLSNIHLGKSKKATNKTPVTKLVMGTRYETNTTCMWLLDVTAKQTQSENVLEFPFHIHNDIK